MLGLKTWVLALLLLLTLSVSVVLVLLPAEEAHRVATTIRSASTEKHALLVGARRYAVQFALTPEQQALGLGGRTTLAAGEGMLFLYGREQNLCFWMKGMRLSIDMIWIDSDKRVTHIEPEVSPLTYPNAYCHNGAYVLEFSAGQAAARHLMPGQHVTF
ncbi:MAG TPA: DUF192 domain-containing protein [Bacillota bacterium]|nr:DUF192 domain-containing protein [Bacillota bacterium]